MAKLTLSNPSSLANDQTFLNTIAANNDLVESAIENTLSRDGSSPNEMESDLDMNSYRVMNLPLPINDAEPVRKGEFDEFEEDFNSGLADLATAVANGSGAANGTAAIQFNAARFNKISGSTGSSLRCLHFTNSYNYGNIVEAMDHEVATNGIVIDDADTTNNTFIGGTYASLTNGFNFSAGSNNLVINPNISSVTNEVVTGTGYQRWPLTSSTDNTLPRFDGTVGKIQTSGAILDDNNRLHLGTAASGSPAYTLGLTETSGNAGFRITSSGNSFDLAFDTHGYFTNYTSGGGIYHNAASATGAHAFSINSSEKLRVSSDGLELGHATDTTFSRLAAGVAAVEGGAIPATLVATVQGSAVSLTNNINTAQSIFASANDTLTVLASTSYRFKAYIHLNTGTTTHTTAFGLGGTATFTSIAYTSQATSSAADTLATPQQRRVSAATASVLTATSGAATTELVLEGIMRINGAGTIIPQVTFSAGPTGTCEVAVNSFIELWPIGSNTVAAIGAWA